MADWWLSIKWSLIDDWIFNLSQYVIDWKTVEWWFERELGKERKGEGEAKSYSKRERERVNVYDNREAKFLRMRS